MKKFDCEVASFPFFLTATLPLLYFTGEIKAQTNSTNQRLQKKKPNHVGTIDYKVQTILIFPLWT